MARRQGRPAAIKPTLEAFQAAFEGSRRRVSLLVSIPTILRSYTGGAAEVTAEPGTLRRSSPLDAAYPGIGGRILDESGQLRRFVNVYVGDEDVRFADGLDTQVPAGAQVSVIPAVAGGADSDAIATPSQRRYSAGIR